MRCALDCGSGLPSQLPAAIVFDRTGDPLEAAAIADEYRDRPDDLLAKGILARDGGHFGAIFPSRPAADRFVQAAQGILATQLSDFALFHRRHTVPPSCIQGDIYLGVWILTPGVLPGRPGVAASAGLRGTG